MDSLILSRLKRRVELALVLAASLSGPAVFAAPGTGRVEAVNEIREPDPIPQVEPHSDYGEARVLLGKRQWEEAAIVLRTVLKKNPDFFPGAMDLARALVYLGRREEALTLLARMESRQAGARRAAATARIRVVSKIFLTQETFQVYQNGLNLLGQQRYRAARERFEKALGVEPDNVEILARIGECLVLEGDHDSAAERLRIAKRLDPYESEVSLWLGRSLHQRGELGEALKELKLARDGLPGSERAPIWYAEALSSAGNRRAAVQTLESDIEARPLHLSGILALARLRIESFAEGRDSLWTARRDLQVALSRIGEYASGETRRSESDLGVELSRSSAELKGRIEAMLAQLDGKLGSR